MATSTHPWHQHSSPSAQVPIPAKELAEQDRAVTVAVIGRARTLINSYTICPAGPRLAALTNAILDECAEALARIGEATG